MVVANRYRIPMSSITPQQALLFSVTAALATMALKTGAWWLTGSVGYLSDALESGVNLAGASFALAMVRLARTPPDD
jgi:divalent metal cation (Fe/Co/Zn/Cd) transporter